MDAQLGLSSLALPHALKLLTATAQGRTGEHRLGDWALQNAFPNTAFANCTKCGAGVVVDQAPGLATLDIDGDALRVECVPPNQATMDRAIRKRVFRFERDGDR